MFHVKLKDKKFLAEWMGKLVVAHFIEFDGKLRDRELWNPDTNHEQFKEVWNKLTAEQKYKVNKKCFRRLESDYDLLTMALNKLPKVMDAVMEVIKNDL